MEDSRSPSSPSASPITPTKFDEYNQKLQQAALKATRNAVYMPPDISFHRSMDAGLSRDLDAFSTRLLLLTNKLLSLATTVNATAPSKDKKAKLQSHDDVVDNFHSIVVDCTDQLLERTDICLDELLGRTKPPAIAVNPTPAKTKKATIKSKPAISSGHLDPALQHASHIPKPQLSFKRKIDNSDAPWYPSLAHKYNAQVPLGYDYRDSQDQDGESIQAHPYRYEITHFTPPARMFVNQTPIPPTPLSSAALTWVSTPHAFQAMLAKLRQASEIAVDLEHNSYRSYSGFVCLMQLSTRREDWIVDALLLRNELEELNEVFTNPEIVKVFHGADSDILWLQQDFNLYIVNLFDTFHASKLLEFPRHGLATLLEMYCDFVPDKRYQLADWRIRPLPDEMLLYARVDTHFLLYVYDCLRNALIDRSQSRSGSRSPPSSTIPASGKNGQDPLLQVAIARSRETSLRVYQKEAYDAASGSGPGGWDTLARKWNKPILLANNNNSVEKVQRAIYYAVHTWRDNVAREEDESTRYVLPNHYLFQLAERPPNDMAALLKMFPSGPPPVIRRRAKELLDIVRDVVREKSTSPMVEAEATTHPEVAQTAVQVKPTVSGTAKTQAVDVIERDIWTASTKDLSSVTTKRSSLFRTTAPLPAAAANHLTTSKSVLFGQRNVSNGPSSAPHFKQLVSRINSTLVIAPSAPKVTTAKKTEDINGGIDSEVEDILGMQVEVPFVPASERKPNILDERVEDTIVIVGRPHARKRKRSAVPKAISKQHGPSVVRDAERVDSVSKKEGCDSQESEMAIHETSGGQRDFDFSAVPNILDDDPDNEAEDRRSKQKKLKKQPKAKAMSHGNFPAPPKAHSEFKGGNQSHTFRQ
ncbi:hypothetical protein AX15_007824 [Amanita polypyramis BW_CC]|nr:hypothetical protein AX15_007824 [Amanita polypyramis BW_CC]